VASASLRLLYSSTFMLCVFLMVAILTGGVLDSNRSEVESYCGFDLHFLYGHRW
jgi:hypothetical protein